MRVFKDAFSKTETVPIRERLFCFCLKPESVPEIAKDVCEFDLACKVVLGQLRERNAGRIGEGPGEGVSSLDVLDCLSSLEEPSMIPKRWEEEG